MHLTPYRHYYSDATPQRDGGVATSNSAIDALLDKAIRKPSSVGEGYEQEELQRAKAEGLLVRLLGEGNNQNMKKYCRNVLRVRFPKLDEPPTFANGRAIRVITQACGESSTSSAACVTPNTVLRTPARPPIRSVASETRKSRMKLLKKSLREWSEGAASASRQRDGAQRLANAMAAMRLISKLKATALRRLRKYCRRIAHIERLQLRFARKGDLGPSAILLWQYPGCVIAAFAKWRRWTHWSIRDFPRGGNILYSAVRRLTMRTASTRLRLVARLAYRAEQRRRRLLESCFVAVRRYWNLAIASAKVARHNRVRRRFKLWLTLAHLTREARQAHAISPEMTSLKRRVALQKISLAISPRLRARLSFALGRWRQKICRSKSVQGWERGRMGHEDISSRGQGRLEALSASLEYEKGRCGHIEAYLKHVIDETHRKLQQAQVEYDQLAAQHQRSVEALSSRCAEGEVAMERLRSRGRQAAVYILRGGLSSPLGDDILLRKVIDSWRWTSRAGRAAVCRLRRLAVGQWQRYRWSLVRGLKAVMRLIQERRRARMEGVVRGTSMLWQRALRPRQVHALNCLRASRPSHASLVIRHTQRLEEVIFSVIRRKQLRAALADWRAVAVRITRRQFASAVLCRAVTRLVRCHMLSSIAELKGRLDENFRRHQELCRVLAALMSTINRIFLRRALSFWRARAHRLARDAASLRNARRQWATRSLVAVTGRSQPRQMYFNSFVEACRLSRRDRADRVARALKTWQQAAYGTVLRAWSSLCRRLRVVHRLGRVLSCSKNERLRWGLTAFAKSRWTSELRSRNLVCLAGRLQLLIDRHLRSYLTLWRSKISSQKYDDLARRSLAAARVTRMKRSAIVRLRGSARFSRVLSQLGLAVRRALLRTGVYWLRKQLLKCRTARFLTSTVQQVALKHRLQRTAVDVVTQLSEESRCQRLKACFLAWRRRIELLRSKLTLAFKNVSCNHHCSTRNAWRGWIEHVGTQLRSQSVWAAVRQKREYSLSMGLVVLAKVLQRVKTKLLALGFASLAVHTARLNGVDGAKSFWTGQLERSQENTRTAEERAREYALKLQRAHEDVREAEANSEAHLRSIKDWQQRVEQQEARHSEEVVGLRQSLAALQHTLKNERDTNVQLRLEAGQSEAKIEALSRDVDRESRDRLVLAGEVARLRSSEVDVLSAKREIESIEAAKKESEDRARLYEQEIGKLRQSVSEWKQRAEAQEKKEGDHLRKLQERHSFYKQKCNLQEHQIAGLRNQLESVETDLRESHRALLEWQQNSVDMLNINSGGLNTASSLPNFSNSPAGGLSTTSALAGLAEAIERISHGNGSDVRESPKVAKRAAKSRPNRLPPRR
ncbi:hypothetical protein FOZ62_001498 [Perkinsus olseni]|uniref:Uncharacterized protein n=3 Tax=Perkinsus olseni TaxID=32597 RepID=A0A7J6U7E7_PEROL|nr:hypothetical protein FOZ62_001498 [Perkinsus olseni]